jgi:hypothetical protein
MKTIIILLALLLPQILNAQLVNDFRVNDNVTAASDLGGRIDIDEEGNYVIVWTDRRTGRPNVYAQRFDKNSNRLGNNFRVNEFLDSSSAPDIAVSKYGNFAVCWFQTINLNSFAKLKLYDNSGEPITDELYLNDSIGLIGPPRIAVNSIGEYIVTWTHRPNIQSKERIYYQIIDSLGNKIGTNKIADDSISHKYDPDITIFPDNRFIIVWQDQRSPSGISLNDIYYQMFDADGNKIGVNIEAYSDPESNDQTNPVVSADSIGRFCIGFSELNYSEVQYDVVCQLFDVNGNRGNSFKVGRTLDGEYFRSLYKLKNGDLIVAFSKEVPGNNNVKASFQRFDSSGYNIGGVYLVSEQFPSSSKDYTDVVVTNGKIISVWNDKRFDFNDVFCNVRSFTNPDSTVGINQISSEVPEEYKLYQNYPNPFNPSTNIKFDISKTSEVKLSIYDITGREVSVLVNEKLLSGSYEFTFNSTGLSSGVYIYRIKAADFVQTRKMLLVK